MGGVPPFSSSADKWAADRGDLGLDVARIRPDALNNGALTGADRSAALTAYLADKPGSTLTLDPCYDKDSATGGLRLGAEPVILPHSVSIQGAGKHSPIIVDPGATGPVIKANIDANGDLIESEGGGTVGPGFDNSRISSLFFNGSRAVAAGNSLADTPMILLGDSRTVEDVESYGVQTLISSPPGLYLDGLTLKKIMVSGQPDGTKAAIELGGTSRKGDGLTVEQLHLVRNDASANRPRAGNIAYARGAKFENCINGDYTFTACTSLMMESFHNETGQMRLIGSTGSVIDGIHWMRAAAPNNVPPIAQELVPGAQSVVMSDMAYVNQMFAYQEGIASFAYDTLVHNLTIANGSGNARIENCCQITLLNGISASPSGKSGIRTGNPIFDAYSHFASIESRFSVNKWLISGTHGALGTFVGGNYVYADGLQIGASGPDIALGTWNLPSGTYYFKVVPYLDLPRKLAQPTVNEVSMVLANGGGAAKLYLDLGRGPKMLRIYIGTASGSYNRYIDVPWIEGDYIGVQGDRIRCWAATTRTAGPVDAIANPRPAHYTLRPGDATNTAAYGNVEVWSWYTTAPPVQGAWNAGDLVMLMIPTGGILGWQRVTNGSSHVLGTDWIALAT